MIAHCYKNIASPGPLPVWPGWAVIIFDYQYFAFIYPLRNAYEHLAMHLMHGTYFGVLCMKGHKHKCRQIYYSLI